MNQHGYFQGASKTALRREIQTLLLTYKYNQEFSSSLLSDLVYEKHYYCSRHKLRPTLFRKGYRKGGGYNFEAFFPAHGWHRVSWRQCINPHSERELIGQALRNAVQPIIAAYKSEHPVCERCCSKSSEEVDHMWPAFSTIMENAMRLILTMNLDDLQTNFDWWSKKSFTLADDNPALIYTLQAHENAALQALCRKCHEDVTRHRRIIDESLRYAA